MKQNTKDTVTDWDQVAIDINIACELAQYPSGSEPTFELMYDRKARVHRTEEQLLALAEEIRRA